MKKLNQQEIAINEFLASKNIELDTLFVEKTNRDEWPCYEWRVKFTRPQKDGFSLPFYMGLAHVEKLKNSDSRPLKPSAASVLYSLSMDFSCSGESFESFCDESGYEKDSIKVLRIYDSVLSQNKKYSKFFNNEEIEKIAELLQDY